MTDGLPDACETCHFICLTVDNHVLLWGTRLVEGEPDCIRPWHKLIPLSRIENELFSTGDSDTCNCAFCFKLVVVYPALPRSPFALMSVIVYSSLLFILVLHGLYIHTYVPTTIYEIYIWISQLYSRCQSGDRYSPYGK